MRGAGGRAGGHERSHASVRAARTCVLMRPPRVQSPCFVHRGVRFGCGDMAGRLDSSGRAGFGDKGYGSRATGSKTWGFGGRHRFEGIRGGRLAKSAGATGERTALYYNYIRFCILYNVSRT